MPDEEYHTYLKKQSYDDLLLISNGIDREQQVERYQMLLAEIAERDKRGEKPAPKVIKTPNPFFTLALGGLFILKFVLAAQITWWSIFHLVFGILGLVVGLSSINWKTKS